MLPKLRFLDSKEVSMAERQNSHEFVTNMNDENDHGSIFNAADMIARFLTRKNKVVYEYNALPTPKREPGEHKGKCLFVEFSLTQY